ETLAPGWQDEWLMNFTTLQTGGFVEKDLVMDGWTDIAKRIRDKVLEDPEGDFSAESMLRAFEESDDEKMIEIRQRVETLVDDDATAEALKPWYRQLCKRPCFHDEYLQAYNNPDVTLVDTDGQGVERITETGIVAGGESYELDCIIYASGFEVGTEYTRRSGYEVHGRDGRTLTEHWADGMRSLHGIHVHGFPNLFVIGPSQGANLISNIPHNLVEAGQTTAAVIRHALDIGAREVEVTADAEAGWIERLLANFRGFGGNPECTPGYYNNEGQPTGRRGQLNAAGFPEGPVAYFAHIDRWRSSGDYEGLDFRP
ncbi:MAG: monooxygenase, partial [Acidimicrobiales bacterium]